MPRHLLILDDAPSFAHDLQGDNWTLRTRTERYPFLGAKFAAMTQMAIEEFGARYVVWFQDDDVYFPHYLQYHLEVLQGGADLSIPSRIRTNYRVGRGKSVLQDNKLMHHGAWGFSADIYQASKGYPQDWTERCDMILRDHLKVAGAKIGDCIQVVPQYLYRWFTASRNGSSFGKEIMASQDNNPVPEDLQTSVEIALDEETQTFYHALGYGNEYCRKSDTADDAEALEIKKKNELVLNAKRNTISVGYLFQTRYVSFLNHKKSMEEIYFKIGVHKQSLLKIWIYTGNIIVFDFLLHDYQIAFDIKFSSDSLVVDVIERSRKLVCAYDGVVLNFSKTDKYKLLEITAGLTVIYEMVIILINRFLSAMEKLIDQHSKFIPYVISMRPDFWTRIEKQFDNWPNAPVLWPATDGRKLDLDELVKSGVIELMSSLKQGAVSLTRGEIGCYYSHLRLWKNMLIQNTPLIAIFEDDADISEDLMEWVNNAMLYLDQWDLVYLGYNWNPSMTPIRGVGDFYTPNLSGHYHVLIGYLITNSGAKKLVQNALPMQMPVDCYVASQIKVGLICWQTKESRVSPVAGTYSSTQGIR